MRGLGDGGTFATHAGTFARPTEHTRSFLAVGLTHENSAVRAGIAQAQAMVLLTV
ncbi:hypothetical protein AKJ09_10976 [Labilithrix luteola]|uniref:Uncharacterized protein n=1 Tax=Labilithrix luteola TaxID=1391654 RepID=A0A0K1QF13_9BACT|nr:hypothetical protein AKJ09_10976 [Labilithrix luteola]